MNKKQQRTYYESFDAAGIREIAISREDIKISESEIKDMTKSAIIEEMMNVDFPQEKPKEAQQTVLPLPTENDGSLAGQIGALIAASMGEKVKEEKLNEIITPHIERIEKKFDKTLKLFKKGIVNKVEITKPDEEPVTIDDVHKSFHRLVELASVRIPVFLSGPAGSFKTTSAQQLAQAMKLPYYPVSVGAQTTKTDLMGYMDANGKYNESPVYKAYTGEGGVLLLDEIDAGNANTLTMLNALLSSDMASFPNGTQKRSNNFVCVVAGNTWGYGASREYVGRNQLDGAFLNRFAFLPWEYDEALETKLSGNESWAKYVQAVRKVVFDMKIKIIVSPRASIFGGKLLATGLTEKEVQELILWNSVGEDIKSKIINNLPSEFKDRGRTKGKRKKIKDEDVEVVEAEEVPF